MNLIETIEIGDGKIPNKYWVSISNDYYYNENDGCYTWISDLGIFEVKGKTLKLFNSYVKAREYANSLIDLSELDGIEINCISIEDRLSGQLWEWVKHLEKEKGIIRDFIYEDIRFSANKLGVSELE